MNAHEVKNMTAKTTVCTAVAVLASVIFSASAGDFYDNERTNNVFTVDAATADLDDPPWTKPSSGGSASTDSGSDRIVIDTNLDDPLVYTSSAASGEIALVKALIVVSPNDETPATTGLSEAQAALTTVTNTTNNCLDWYGLVKVNDAAAWVALDGDHPVAGQTYDVEIALDNREGYKKIRYSVKGPVASGYTVLTSGDERWLANPQNKTSISAVAFSGVGSFGDFSADTVVNDAVTIASVGETAGFDFEGGSVTAVVSAASGSFAGKTATLSIVDFEDGTTKTFDAVSVPNTGILSWDLSDKITTLTPGATYSYTVSISGGPSATGTFTAANWYGTQSDGSWFSATAAGGNPVTHNGAWANTYLVPEPEVTNDTQYAIYGDASFQVSDKEPGSNAVSRVDTKYQFETFVSASALQVLDDAVSGIVAATNESGAAWYAYTDAGWQPLDAGAPVPAVDTTYILRAEFDFKSSPKRVRYLVSTDDSGATFVPLTLESKQWINLANQAKTTLSEVSISGKGILTSIYAEVADPSVAVDNAGVRYDTLWEAITSGTQPITLLTNATLSPNGLSGRRKFRIIDNGFEVKYDNAASAKWWLHKKDDYWYLMRFGGSYIFQ